MIILGIETSCDETSASLVGDGHRILSLVTSTQIDFHRIYGGVVPEIASRLHAETIREVTRKALEDASADLEEIDAVAATSGPGLLGSLLVGVSFANALALSLRKPCMAINHLEAHIYSAFMEFSEIEPPVVALLVSGGHTAIVFMEDFGRYRMMGSTLDDAAGEAFDKIAFFLGLGYPGGPAIEKAALKGNRTAFEFPRAMLRHKRLYDFSFSGLKTSVINKVRSLAESPELLPEKVKLDVAASFQEAVCDALVAKTIASAEESGVKRVVLTGGVAANLRLREKLGEACEKKEIRLFTPSMKLCGDNAAMIAGLAFYKRHQALEFIDDVSSVKPI
ncbi:MAG: tRNA (adenosine(37)-N6)-threonylcarbamoyltransferase complex transferase subunit TsaD [Candidatus Aureabacteria bacterium]|nr:tRNA (adenosine(37)-N6)-threonylcarbamoyltransferase complex transferase subunit TsaD [Candidatus Auribacterota bacterium]